jgi:murein DD-endopeptidase MepM/ murein hydrolase activator NlpD
MHTLNRLLVLVLCALLIVPGVGSLALVSMQDRQRAEDSLHTALQKAVGSYRQRTGLQSLRTRNQKTIEEEGKKLVQLMVRQRQLRDAIVSLRATIAKIQSHYSVKIESASGALALMEREKKTVVATVRLAYMQSLSRQRDEHGAGRELVQVTLLEAAGPAAAAVRLADITSTHLQYLQDLSLAAQTFQQLDRLTEEREALLANRLRAERSYEGAQQVVEISVEELEEIKRIMTDVHNQVLRMQGELARIDARLRAKAERALLEKGLIDPLQPGEERPAAKRPAFSWPVYGPISAGFLNASYRKYFGVPHYGLDIVVGQSTPVHSSADGVVFLVRDGGEKGYTYILIGHRNGYATLYGHLSETLVEAGQEVTAGELIGLSGGQPGTPGAGPMTTGAHVHFEVMQSGVNVDPKTVLP